MAHVENGCIFCTNPGELYESGNPSPTESEVRIEPEEAQTETFEVHEPEIDLNDFDFGEEDSAEPPFDPTNLDFIPDCNNEEEPVSDGIEDADAQAYLDGEDFKDTPDSESYVKSGRSSSPGQLKRKHDRQDEQALAAKAAKFEKAQTSKNASDAHTAAVKAGEAQKGLKKFADRRAKKDAARHKAKKT